MRKAALALTGAATVLGIAAAPLSSSASTAALGNTIAVPHIHMLPTLQHHDDCFPPVIVSVACGGAGVPMSWGGGAVQTNPAVYIVYWGWNGSDPAGEAAYQQSFFTNIGGTTFPASQTQYCENATGILGTTCGSGPFVGNPSGLLKGTWSDNTDAIPSGPTDADIQAEAIRAAAHFGNTTAASNASTQYIIDTPSGNSTSGFNTQWCAYHGMASSSYGGLSYTNFPYIPDAGSNCGQDFVNSGSAGNLDGVSIVGGHEFAESATDPDPGLGWTDSFGAETGDKCAWISIGPGSATDVSAGGSSYAVQSLWSNDDNSGTGGCVTFYASPSNQH